MNNYQQLANTLLNGLNSQYQTKREIISVNGLTEARNFLLDRGESVILMDANDDVIYVKNCDDTGKFNLKVYECKDVTDIRMLEGSDTISKKDFRQLSEEVAELKSMLTGVVNEHDARKQQKPYQPVSEVQK